jgi:CubicO group peptidase (beta-lactamase class C family)
LASQAATLLTSSVAPGVALGIVDRNGNLAIRCYGERVVDAGRPVDEETAFEIGSIGKSFTAIVFMQLAAEGLVELQAPVTRYLPWFSIQGEYRPITIHDVLTHTAGLPGGDDPVPDARAEVWLLRHATTFAAPGKHFLYSNVGYKVLGLVLEAVLAQPYARIVEERIFEPLGMTGAHGAITSAIRPRLAQGYAPAFDDRPRLQRHGIVPATWLETNTGDGCLAMTARDLARYAGMLLRVAQGEPSTVLQPEHLATMRDPHRGETVPLPGYGYALDAYGQDEGRNRFGHSGGMVGYVTQMTIDVAHGLAVVVLANGDLDTTAFASFALDTLIAERSGQPTPVLRSPPSPFDLSAMFDLCGPWQSVDRSITIERSGESGLQLMEGYQRIELQTSVGLRGQGQVIADHPGWEPYPVEIERRKPGEPPGEGGDLPPVKLHWGGETFHRPAAVPTIKAEYPAEWNALVGHYRSYNPWRSNFRIVVREGELTRIGPYGHAARLIADGDRYWVADDPRPANEWLAFAGLVDGNMLVARSNLGEMFARFFTP